MNKKRNLKTIKRRTIAVFVFSFLILNACFHVILLSYKKREELKAAYTAEATVRRIESQFDKYQVKQDVLKKIIEEDGVVSEENLEMMAGYIKDSHDMFQIIQTTEDGELVQLYSVNSMEKALGKQFFSTELGKDCIMHAKASKVNTFAGPVELHNAEVRGMLVDPMYYINKQQKQEFMGFLVLSIDWDNFIKDLELDKLEEASYQYQIWKSDTMSEAKTIIAGSSGSVLKKALRVSCKVPNDTWYFEIIPSHGWFSQAMAYMSIVICIVFAIVLAFAYWQYSVKRYQDEIYAIEIQKSEAQARKANAAKTDFLSRMSHDIRTPLNGIIGIIKINEDHADDKELVQKNREKMKIAANHLLSLINDVLQMSKLESDELVLAHEVFSLNDLAVDVMTIMENRATESGIKIQFDIDSDKVKYPFVYGSPLHIRQLFLNIYGNCIKYNKPGGSVVTQFFYVGEKDGIVTYKWMIADTGIGMTKEFLKHIFEPFAQEHSDARSVYQGTGLGMAIVKALVDKMGGTITVESEEGAGSTFWIELPFEIASEPEQREKVEDKTESICGLHLILAEDNDLNAEIAQVLLEDQGAVVTVVRDGQQAVEAFAKEKADAFDAILMDVMMPVMDGFTATRNIRALDRKDAKNIPIIAMTANAFDEDVRKCLEAGMNAHLSKPLQMDKVVATIARYCKSRE